MEMVLLVLLGSYSSAWMVMPYSALLALGQDREVLVHPYRTPAQMRRSREQVRSDMKVVIGVFIFMLYLTVVVSTCPLFDRAYADVWVDASLPEVERCSAYTPTMTVVRQFVTRMALPVCSVPGAPDCSLLAY